MHLRIKINQKTVQYLLHGQKTHVAYSWCNKMYVIAIYKANNWFQLKIKLGKNEDSFEFITNIKKPYFTLIGIGSTITWKRIPLNINFLNIKRGEEKLLLKYEKDLPQELLDQGIFKYFDNNLVHISRKEIEIKKQKMQLKVTPPYKIIYPN